MEKIKSNYINILACLIVVAAIFTGYIVYSNLDKGFIFNDEAFYLFFFRDHSTLPTVDATNFYHIFNVFFTDNIYLFRLITYALLNTSTFLLYFLVTKYYKLKINPLVFGCLGLLVNFLTWGMTNIVLHQYIGNTILINCSLAFLLLSFLFAKDFFLVASGFFLGLLLFDGIPHTIVLVPIGAFLLYNFWKTSRKTIFYILIGGLLGIVFYFIFLENFSQFISKLEWIKYYQSFHAKQHPKSFYVYWVLKVSAFIFIPSAILISYIHFFARNNKRLLDYLILVISSLFLICIFFYPNIYINYILLALLVYRFYLGNETREKKTFLILLGLIPFALSFGSGAYFDVRGSAYNIYFYLPFTIVILTFLSTRYFLIFAIPLVLQCFNFPKLLTVRGWKYFVFTEQTEKVIINGHTLYLDKARKKDIDDLRPFLQNQPNVIYSSNHLMGYLYILDAKPPIYYYFTLKDYIQFVLKKVGKSPDDFIYLESNDHPFYPKEIVPLKFVKNPKAYKIVKAGRFTLYLPASFQKNLK